MCRSLTLTLVLACGGAQVAAPEQQPPTDPQMHAVVSSCEAEPAEPDAPPAAPTENEVLTCDDVEQRPAGPRTVPRRATRHLRVARRAQREERFLEAVAAFEAALRVAPNDPGVLGELGWARHAASSWCDENLPDENDYDAFQDEDGPPQVDPLVASCEPMNDPAAADELARALATASEPARRGALHYNMGRILERSDPEQAGDHYRVSLCLRPNDTVRSAFARSLSRSAREEWAALDGESALQLMHAAALFDPEMQADAQAAETLWRAEWALQPVAPSMDSTSTSLEELCAQLSEEECELVSEWTEGDRWALAELRYVQDTSMDRTRALVARTPRGLEIFAELGTDSGDNRHYNSYVANVQIEPSESGPIPFMLVTWDLGQASAAGCGWESSASTEVLVCSRDTGCFARGTLGPIAFESDSMLPTVQESLGSCDDTPSELLGAPSAPTFNVSFDEREIVVERAWDATMRCLPLVETLCALPTAPQSCP